MEFLMVVDHLTKLKHLSPLIICGAARSGTRMMTDIVNTHPEISVQEEMHAKTIEAFFHLKQTIDENFRYYSDRKGVDLSKHWKSSKGALLLSYFTFANKKTELGHGKELKMYGIKTPGYERYLTEFEDIFEKKPPYYIYCLRNPSSVWRSWKSLSYLTDYKVFLNRYRRSIRQAIKLKNTVKERFVIFELDSFIKAKDKNSFILDNIFARLPIRQDLELMNIEMLENRNSIKRKSGSSYIKDKSLDKELSLIEKDIKLVELLEILRN